MICFIFTGYIGANCNLLHAPEKEDYRISLTKNINYELGKDEFHSYSKDGAVGVYFRDRKLTIRRLIILIMSLNRAIQRELDSFFKKIDSADCTLRGATKGAFSQTRSKLNELGFIRLNEVGGNQLGNLEKVAKKKEL